MRANSRAGETYPYVPYKSQYVPPLGSMAALQILFKLYQVTYFGKGGRWLNEHVVHMTGIAAAHNLFPNMIGCFYW